MSCSFTLVRWVKKNLSSLTNSLIKFDKNRSVKKVKILAEIFGWDQINLTQYKHLFPRIYGGLLSILGIFALEEGNSVLFCLEPLSSSSNGGTMCSTLPPRELQSTNQR